MESKEGTRDEGDTSNAPWNFPSRRISYWIGFNQPTLKSNLKSTGHTRRGKHNAPQVPKGLRYATSFPARGSENEVRKRADGVLWNVGYELVAEIGGGGFSTCVHLFPLAFSFRTLPTFFLSACVLPSQCPRCASSYTMPGGAFVSQPSSSSSCD